MVDGLHIRNRTVKPLEIALSGGGEGGQRGKMVWAI
jgi:hypothetical protein